MNDKPVFRFHPGAYDDGAFQASDDICSACGKACVWRYVNSIYALPPDPQAICARCIADGRLANAVPDGDYTLHDCEFDEEPSDALAAEVEQRTPGFATFNAFVWPVRNGIPLAFLGFGEDASLANKAEVKAAIAEAGAELSPGYAIIFRSLDGGVWVAAVDPD